MTKFKGLLEATKIHRPNTEEEGFLKGVPPRRGRPPGKRSHPDFDLYPQRHPPLKIVLLKNGRKEFSELVEELYLSIRVVASWILTLIRFLKAQEQQEDRLCSL